MKKRNTTGPQSGQKKTYREKRRSRVSVLTLLACAVLLSLMLVGLTNQWGAGQSSAKAALGTPCDLRYAPYTVRQLTMRTSNLNNGWAPDSRHIAYADPADRSIKVYDIQTNTTVATLTPPMAAAAPEWSADGRHIYFSARPSDTSTGTGPTSELTHHAPPDMYMMNADGSDKQKIAIDSPMPSGSSVIYWDSTTPAKFSPDGHHVAFSTLQGVTSDTLAGLENASWVMLLGDLVTIDGTPHLRDVHPLNSPSPLWHEVKGFTRNSKELLFGADTTHGSSSSTLNPDVYTLNLVAGVITRYTSNPAWEETMDVDPVGPFIVFNSDRANPTPPQAFAQGLASGHHDLYLAGMQGDAGWIRRLTTDGDSENGGWASTKPRWSSNGREILFQQRLNQTTRTMLLTFTCTTMS